MGIPGEQIAKAVARARRIANLDGEVEALYHVWDTTRDARQFAKALSDAKRRMSEDDFAAIIIALSARTGMDVATLRQYAKNHLTQWDRWYTTVLEVRNV